MGHLPDFEPIDTATVRERQNHVMRVGNKELVNPVVFFGGGRLLATATATLRGVFRQRLALDIARVGQRDHHLLRRDQVFGLQLLGVGFNHAAALIPKLCANGF